MSECSRPNCDGRVAGRSLCAMHYAKTAKWLKRHGKWESLYADAQSCREHIVALRDAGLGWPRIAYMSGVPAQTLERIAKRGQQQVLRETVYGVLSVPLPTVPFGPELADGAQISALGTTRRLRALVALGHRLEDVAHRLGLKDRSHLSKLLCGKAGKVTAGRARAVDVLFRELQVTLGDSENCRRLAQRKGWVTPLAWANIDDPDELPDTRSRGRVSFMDTYRELKDLGYGNHAAMAVRLGLSLDSFERSYFRHNLHKESAA